MDGHEYYFVDDDDDDEYETRNRINIEKRRIKAKFPLESCNLTWIPLRVFKLKYILLKKCQTIN